MFYESGSNEMSDDDDRRTSQLAAKKMMCEKSSCGIFNVTLPLIKAAKINSFLIVTAVIGLKIIAREKNFHYSAFGYETHTLRERWHITTTKIVFKCILCKL